MKGLAPAAILTLAWLCMPACDASGLTRPWAAGLEARYRHMLQETSLAPVEERFKRLDAIEAARVAWLEYLRFAGLPVPADEKLPEAAELASGDPAPWASINPSAVPAFLRTNPHVEAWHPQWGETDQRTRRVFQNLDQPGIEVAALRLAEQEPEKSKLQAYHEKLGTFQPNLEQQGKLVEQTARFNSSKLLHMEIPELFSGKPWWLWKKNPDGDWRKALLHGTGGEAIWQMVMGEGEVSYLFTFAGTVPRPDQKAAYHFVVDTRKPDIAEFKVLEKDGILYILWRVSDGHLSAKPVRMTIYGTHGKVFSILGSLPVEGRHETLKKNGPEMLGFAVLEVTDLAGNFNSATLRF